MSSQRYQSIRDLARLPWFDVGPDGDLLADPGVGGAIDVHCHLAQGILGGEKERVRDGLGAILEYLPHDRPFDLDPYANKNFAPERLSEMSRDLTVTTLGRSALKSTHTLPNLRRRMRELRLAKTVILPIELPLGASSAHFVLDVTSGCEETICFGSVHPFRRGPETRVAAQARAGARGIKLHPAVQLVRPDADRAMRIYRACAEHQLPLFFHCGPVDIEPRLGRYLSQVRHYERAIAENPRTTFVLGHSGALQFEEGLALARRYGNVWLELASQGLPAVRRILESADPGRILWGTDWPFYHQAMGLAKLLLATDGDETLRRQVLSGNARRLLGLAES